MVSSPSSHLSQMHQLHLHVATYSYFVRIYAMYPCNLLSYLRQHYGQRDSLPVFNRTIRVSQGGGRADDRRWVWVDYVNRENGMRWECRISSTDVAVVMGFVFLFAINSVIVFMQLVKAVSIANGCRVGRAMTSLPRRL